MTTNVSSIGIPPPCNSSTQVSCAAMPPRQETPPSVSESFAKSTTKTELPFFLDTRKFSAYDPSSGQLVFFDTREEMDVMIQSREEAKVTYMKLASAGDPKSVEAIHKILVEKLKVGNASDYATYNEYKAAVIDAAKQQAGSMTIAELQVLAYKFPELNSIITERVAQAKARGIHPEAIVNMTAGAIDELAKQKLAAPKLNIV